MSETIESDAPAEVISETEPTGTALVAAVTQNPGMVLVNPAKFDAFYCAIEADVKAHVADLTTSKGREAVKSLAFKVTKTWTAIEAAADVLTEDAKALIKSVNDNKKGIKERLYGLRDEVKAPLVEWETAEATRVALVNGTISWFEDSAKVEADETLAAVESRLAEVAGTPIDAERFGDAFDRAGRTRAATIDILNAAIARIKRQEADAAELAELRRIKAERDEADRLAAEEAERVAAAIEADRIGCEAAAQAEANALEMQRLAEEAAENRRIAQEAMEAEAERVRLEAAAEAARLEDERVREAEREAARRATQLAEEEAARALKAVQDEADAQVRRVQAALEAAQAEAARLFEEQAAAAREAARLEAHREGLRLQAEAEEQKRQANVAHRRKVLREAVTEIAGIVCLHKQDDESSTNAVAIAIAEAIRDGAIPHVTMQF